MTFRKVRWATIFLLGFVLTSIVYAQIRSATITGTVTDQTGGIVAGAEVTLINQETNIKESFKTAGTGQYTFPYLPAGTYTVTVTMPAFSQYRQTGIILATAQTLRVDIALTVGALASTVEVAATAAQVQTDSATVQAAIQQEMIAALPNPEQNPMYYAGLQNGVVPRNATADTTSLNSFGIGTGGRRQYSAFGVNGGRTWTNDIQLDGLPVMAGGYNEASVIPNTEGLQEVRVIANDFSAQYGHGQSVISMSTRSGTNGYHGEGDYSLRNEALNANTNYNNANGIYRPAFKVHDVGGAVGGPIRKDKLFFFTSYHYTYHNRGTTSLMTVPTDLERKGDFSKTNIRDASGLPVAAQIFDPYNVTQVGTNLYQRTLIPNAIIPNPNPYALLMYSYYPEPNRTPDDAFNTNNFQATTVTQVRRDSLNNRVDYRRGAHSIYGSGGLFYATILSPRPFGKAPFNDEAGITKDKNPFGQIGDVWVLNPTLVVDMRFGYNRVGDTAYAGNKTGWTASSYAGFGIPSNILPYMAVQGTAPVVQPNNLTGGSGGGSNWTDVSSGQFGTHHEGQSSYNLSGSVTKTHGKWTHRMGVEVRNLESNYMDLEEPSADIASTWFQSGGNFNFQYLNANGGTVSQDVNNNQKGVNGAGLLLGAGLWWIRPGANAMPAFSQKYFALYSQNDWRATSKLTLNLGLRWDLQPGPTERYNRMSGADLTVKSNFGPMGAIDFPGMGGYSRNLWNTEYNDWGPRVGAAYQLTPKTVLRGGFGISYLPSNSGYFASAVDYGTDAFAGGTLQQPYGPNPNGTPVGHFWDPESVSPASGANPAAAINYGISEAKFDRFFKNGRAIQWNYFIERTFARSWFASVGYTGTHSSRLMNRNFPINSIQMLSTSLLSTWHGQYVASNGVTNPATVQIPNPFQPASGPLLNFTGALGAATLDQQTANYPFPLLGSAGLNQSKAWANYDSLQLRLSHAFSNGFHLEVNYTWSKELDNTDTMEDNQGLNSGGTAGNLNTLNMGTNYRLGFSDMPQRLVVAFLYETPFGTGKPLEIRNKVLRSIVGKWQTGGAVIDQSGMPFNVNGDNSGAAYGHPDQVAGVPLEVPAALQHWYNGTTTVTLPDGRQITPTKNTFLKYYEGAFRGRVITTPNGSVVPDVYWWGTVGNTLNALRSPGRST